MANKTNAMRILDQNKVNYSFFEYESKITNGMEVANILGEDPKRVFKTLVTVSNSGRNYVFCIPVASELDLKKAAKLTNSKNIEMIKQKDLLPLTGYIHGGCSPIGMKKLFETFIDSSGRTLDYIYVSAGALGKQVKIDPNVLVKLIGAKYSELIKE